MDRFIRIAAYLTNLGAFVFAVLVLFNSRSSRDLMMAGIILVPSFISLFALYLGPDLEERRLSRRLNKARMKDELARLEAKKP